MQVRCRHCNRPYALGRDEVQAALDIITTENLKHYNSYCPHCGKTNRFSQKQMRRSAPWWTATPKVENSKAESDETG